MRTTDDGPTGLRLALFRWLGVRPQPEHRDWLRRQLLEPDWPRQQVLRTAAVVAAVGVLVLGIVGVALGQVPWGGVAGFGGALGGTLLTLLTPKHNRTVALRKGGFLRADKEKPTVW